MEFRGSACFLQDPRLRTITGSGHCYNNDKVSIQLCRSMGFHPSEEATMCRVCEPEREFCCSYPGLFLPEGPPLTCSATTTQATSSPTTSHYTYAMGLIPAETPAPFLEPFATLPNNFFTTENHTSHPAQDAQSTTSHSGLSVGNISELIFTYSTAGATDASQKPETGNGGTEGDGPLAYCNRPQSTQLSDGPGCYIASLYESQTNSVPFGLRTFGVGVLVDPQWVLTTAIRFPTSIESGRFWAKIGQLPQSIPYKVTTVIPQTSVRYPENGLSLLKLEHPVDMTRYCTACLTDPDSDQEVTADGYGGDCVAVGFNATNAFGRDLNDGSVQRVEYNILGKAACEEARKKMEHRHPPQQVWLRQQGNPAAGWFCGGKPGQKSCMKDYGAPLICMDRPKGFQRVAGMMVSTGCIDDEMRGVGTFIEVGSVRDWIQYEIGRPMNPRAPSPNQPGILLKKKNA
ncbi:uncharacterized protein LOC129598815 isoform X2 [Paramacrobiotus metropolitanus]|uniref:uncharacterized protein LOC129598815 isoform X2 n=1 Tax=Paramacrobiotus metropolitanus TaxID=2943436 RepID=UPI0024462546|nr:uncharacterized protein LOC129598815 isoform X2 [Paramacrobiotus metropolitanus]